MQWKKAALLSMFFVVLMAGVWARPAQATDFRSGETVVIGPEEVIDDDLFITGNKVIIDGTVNGDLIASGAEIEMNGEVGGSLVLGGTTLLVDGVVKGSVYSGGYSLTLGPNADIGRNVYFGGFSLIAKEGSQVGRGVYSGSYQTILDGAVATDVSYGGGALEVNGTVGGDISGTVQEADGLTPIMPPFPGIPAITPIAPGFRQGERADIGGDINVEETADSSSSVSSGISVTRTLLARLGEFIALLIIGGLLLRLLPGHLQEVGDVAQERPLPSAGRGCLISMASIAVFIAASIILFILTVIAGLVTFGSLSEPVTVLGGATLFFVTAVFWFIFAFITKIVVSFVVGRLILGRAAPDMEAGLKRDFIALLIGALLYEIVRAIPLGIGWLIGFAVTMVGLGAIYLFISAQRSGKLLKTAA